MSLRIADSNKGRVWIVVCQLPRNTPGFAIQGNCQAPHDAAATRICEDPILSKNLKRQTARSCYRLQRVVKIKIFADTADAVGGRSRERALAIMRDHAIGTYGAGALVLDVLVKAAALASLAGRSRVVLEALAAGALSRAVPVVLALALPPVRADGAGAAFHVAPRAVIIAIVLAAALAIPADPLLIAVAAAGAVVMGAWLHWWLGGHTGDTLGAAVELAETAVLVAAAGLA